MQLFDSGKEQQRKGRSQFQEPKRAAVKMKASMTLGPTPGALRAVAALGVRGRTDTPPAPGSSRARALKTISTLYSLVPDHLLFKSQSSLYVPGLIVRTSTFGPQ